MASAARRAGWAIAALCCAWLFHAFFEHPTSRATVAGLLALAAAAVLRPYPSLLVLAALGPLSTVLLVAGGVGLAGFRLLEAMVLACLTGWAARHALRPAPLAVAPAVAWSAALLLLAALASGVLTAATFLTESFGGIGAGLAAGALTKDYAIQPQPLGGALLFAEGLALLLVVADVCGPDRRRRDGMRRMLVAGATAAALFNVLRLVMISVARGDAWSAFATYFATLRVNVHHADLNAAGSYFAMALLMAAGLAGRSRLPALACSTIIAAGLWISGSRTAMAAAFLSGAAWLLLRLRAGGNTRAALAIGAAGAIAAGTVFWLQYPAARNAEPSLAWAIRLELAGAALAMTADHPWFGVGLGHFHDRSAPYIDMPAYLSRENAHNNYLQVLAELGIPGLALFLLVLAAAFAAAWRRSATDPRPAGVMAGVAAFLLTCLGGHPLLIPLVAYPFWMGIGLMAATDEPRSLRKGLRRAGLVAGVLIAMALPLRTVSAVRAANLEHTAAGFSRWQREPDGSRYRWTGGRAAFHVPSGARAVRIPIAAAAGAPDPLEVRILVNGREANRVVLRAAEGSRTVRLLLPRAGGGAAFARIEMEAWTPGASAPLDVAASDTGGVLKVGRPLIDE